MLKEYLSTLANAFRSKLGTTEKINAQSFPDKVTAVYDKGFNDGKEQGGNIEIDESKIIEKTVTGKGSITVTDISEIPHDIGIQLSSDTITDFSNVTLKKYNNNLFIGKLVDGSFNSANGDVTESTTRVRSESFTYLAAGTYTLLTDEGKKLVIYIYDGDGKFISSESIITWQSNRVTFTINGSRLMRFGIRLNDTNATILPEDVNIVVLEKGSNITEEIVEVNADGSAECESISSMMTLFVDSSCAITMLYWKSYGMQTEYDRFWDNIQIYGGRTKYSYGFYGSGWNNITFKPKYDLRPTEARAMFSNSRITDLAQILKDCNVKLDLSQCASIGDAFSYCPITHLPELDLRNLVAVNFGTYNSSGLHTIDKVILRDDGSQTFDSNLAPNSANLANITFEGTIGNNFKLTNSKLSVESLMSIINHLQDLIVADKDTCTLTIGTTNLAKLTDEEKAIATNRGWTLA